MILPGDPLENKQIYQRGIRILRRDWHSAVINRAVGMLRIEL
jgi:hypothetical protein